MGGIIYECSVLTTAKIEKNVTLGKNETLKILYQLQLQVPDISNIWH